jgi:hypothetical protein
MRVGWRRGDGDGERWREREVEVISTRNGTSEHEVSRGCLTSTQTRRRGGNGPICLTRTEMGMGRFARSHRSQTRAYLYAEGKGKTQVFYETKVS